MEDQTVNNFSSVDSTPVTQFSAQSTQKTTVLLLMLLVVLVSAVIFGFGGYYFGKNSSSTMPYVSNIQDQTPIIASPQASPVQSPSAINTLSNVPADWKTYVDPETSFTFSYPKDWTITKQGGVAPWIEIYSPDNANPGDQEPSIGMTIGFQLFEKQQSVSSADLQQLVKDKGVSKQYKVHPVEESHTTISNFPAFRYEYEGSESPYLFHFWGVNVAKDKTIISLSIADIKRDQSLDSASIVQSILSSIKIGN
jgi:hypothetical protein